MSVTVPEGTTPPAGQDQQPPETTPPAAPAPVIGTGPWAADLAAQFTDAEIRGQVDQFMRERVQPHTTKLEQEVAASKDAMNLWKQFEENPVDAYVAVTHELFGEDAAQKLLAQLQAEQAQQPVAPQQQPNFDPAADPRIAAALQYIEEQQNTAVYDGELERIKTAHPEIDTDLLHPFIAAAEGNFDNAVELYTEWLSRLTPAETGEEAATTEQQAAPPALGSDTGAAPSTTPVEPRKQSINEAIDEWAAELRANKEAPPVMG